MRRALVWFCPLRAGLPERRSAIGAVARRFPEAVGRSEETALLLIELKCDRDFIPNIHGFARTRKSRRFEFYRFRDLDRLLRKTVGQSLDDVNGPDFAVRLEDNYQLHITFNLIL